MTDATSLLFDLPGFRVIGCVEDPESGGRVITVMGVADVHGCPDCAVIAGDPYDYRDRVIKDLPFGQRPLMLVWHQRRFACDEDQCQRKIFSETSVQIPVRHRLTQRLRCKLEASASGSCRAVSDVAREYRVSWATVHDAIVRKAMTLLPQPAPTTMIGIDETRARSVRWLCDDESKWTRTDPWMTSFVDLDLSHAGGLIGLVPGRSGASVRTWLNTQTPAWRAGIKIVAIDPCAPFASAIRDILPHATIVVDHWHVDRLANLMVTRVRQRAARDQHGRRGRKSDLTWAHRQLLLRAGDRLSPRAQARLDELFATDDPLGHIKAAWTVKEALRRLLTASDRHTISEHLHAFHVTVINADMDETTRLGATIDRWWPELLAFLETRITNARTEGYNRVIKQIKRTGCGYRNQTNYERRIVLHIAAKKAA
jgi:transposase